MSFPPDVPDLLTSSRTVMIKAVCRRAVSDQIMKGLYLASECRLKNDSSGFTGLYGSLTDSGITWGLEVTRHATIIKGVTKKVWITSTSGMLK